MPKYRHTMGGKVYSMFCNMHAYTVHSPESSSKSMGVATKGKYTIPIYVCDLFLSAVSLHSCYDTTPHFCLYEPSLNK